MHQGRENRRQDAYGCERHPGAVDRDRADEVGANDSPAAARDAQRLDKFH